MAVASGGKVMSALQSGTAIPYTTLLGQLNTMLSVLAGLGRCQLTLLMLCSTLFASMGSVTIPVNPSIITIVIPIKHRVINSGVVFTTFLVS